MAGVQVVATMAVMLSGVIVFVGAQGTDRCSPSSPLRTFCIDMPYNTTVFPNMFGHSDPVTAEMEITQFYPLIRVQCSDVLKEFLCSAYFPDCVPEVGTLSPCKQTCQAARRGCETLMNKFGFQWPDDLACERFPDLTQATCLYFESNMTTATTDTTTTTTESPKTTKPTTLTTTVRTTTRTTFNLPKFCNGLPYTNPSFPNVLGHWSFQDAVRNFERFDHMLWSECSEQISQYLCLLHFPTKDEMTGKTVSPCWEFCLKVRTECILMLPVPWPQSFYCETLPSKITPGSKCWGEDSTIHSSPSTQEVFSIVRGVFNVLSNIFKLATSS